MSNLLGESHVHVISEIFFTFVVRFS